MKADVAFVSCVKLKVDHPAPARDLYMRSPWFRGARRYAERQAHSWFILSAAHGLLDPDYEIAPYDLSINWMKDQDRHDWSMLVIRQGSVWRPGNRSRGEKLSPASDQPPHPLLQADRCSDGGTDDGSAASVAIEKTGDRVLGRVLIKREMSAFEARADMRWSPRNFAF